MAKRTDALQRIITRSGLAADNDIYVGPEGELVYITDDDEVRVHDGITAGGIVISGSSEYRGALVHKTADETGADYTTSAAIPWTTEDHDTDSIHDNSTNNSRLTVPSGVTRVRLTGSVRVTDHTANEVARLSVYKNGQFDWIGQPDIIIETSSTNSISITLASSVVTVVGTDYFELVFMIQFGGDSSVTLDNDRSWFAMEIIE